MSSKRTYDAAKDTDEGHACANSVNQNDSSSLHIAIIGSGSAAFACAIKAAESGASVTLIEKAEHVGGTCVNVGCVPSKILIRATQLMQHQRANPFDGITNMQPEIQRGLLSQQINTRVDELREAKYQSILDRNPAITLIRGSACFKDARTLFIDKPDGSQQTLNPDKIMVATGSTPTIPDIEGLNDTPFWTSTKAIFYEAVPQSLAVIGSSAVAVEIAQAYARLGSKVTILARHTLLYSEDSLLGEELTECFKEEGIRVLEYTQAHKVSYNDNLFTLITDDHTLEVQQLLIATGRRANTSELDLQAAGVETDKSGTILVNDQLQSSVKHIYAAGDCTTIPQFVYVAAAAGTKAALNMTGTPAKLDLTTMPAVIFTDPQIATVGLTEKQAEAKGYDVTSRVLAMENVPRALANFNTQGFIKLVAETTSGKLLGAQILAHEGGEIVQSAALAIANSMTVEELASMLFPYLTMVEALKLCAQTFNKDIKNLSCCAG